MGSPMENARGAVSSGTPELKCQIAILSATTTNVGYKGIHQIVR